jgi:hypothetical protein
MKAGHMKKVYSTGHSQIEAGVGFTFEEALKNFVKNADTAGTDARAAFKEILGEDIAAYLTHNAASKALKKLNNKGVYGPLVVEH